MQLKTGEVLINSIDNDGGLLGFDTNLIDKFSDLINVPIIIQGGGGSWVIFMMF